MVLNINGSSLLIFPWTSLAPVNHLCLQERQMCSESHRLDRHLAKLLQSLCGSCSRTSSPLPWLQLFILCSYGFLHPGHFLLVFMNPPHLLGHLSLSPTKVASFLSHSVIEVDP